jgi:hypothetical protein
MSEQTFLEKYIANLSDDLPFQFDRFCVHVTDEILKIMNEKNITLAEISNYISMDVIELNNIFANPENITLEELYLILATLGYGINIEPVKLPKNRINDIVSTHLKQEIGMVIDQYLSAYKELSDNMPKGKNRESVKFLKEHKLRIKNFKQSQSKFEQITAKHKPLKPKDTFITNINGEDVELVVYTSYFDLDGTYNVTCIHKDQPDKISHLKYKIDTMGTLYIIEKDE